MPVQQIEEDKESKVILTIAVVIGIAAVVLLVVIVGFMFAQSGSRPSSASVTNEKSDVIDPDATNSAMPFVAIKTKEGVYENSNVVRDSNGIFKSVTSSKNLKEAIISERSLLAQSAADIKAQGVTTYTIDTYDPYGMESSDGKPKAGTITAIQEYIDAADASSIIFIYAETSKPNSAAVSVPSVVGMTETDAKATLKNRKLKAKVLDAPGGGAAGQVIFQSPEPNRIAPTGGTVYIIVSR